MKTCESCHEQGILKVICHGLPMRLCSNCGRLDGAWSWIVNIVPPTIVVQDGMPVFSFLVYEGPYWRAVVRWFRS